MQTLDVKQMEMIEGGRSWLALSCGAGIALSVLTGPIGALIAGPSTIGLCLATALS